MYLELFLTCSTEGQKGLGVLFDQGLSVTGQRQPVQNQGQEIVGNHSSQVPLELPQDQHLPILEVREEGGGEWLKRTVKQKSHGKGSPSNLNVRTPVLLLGLRTGAVERGVQGREELGTFALSIYSLTRCQTM